VATSQTTKEHIKATYLIEPNPNQKKTFVNFWNWFCRGKESHVCHVLPQFISRWLLFLKYNSGNTSRSIFIENSAQVNLQEGYIEPADRNFGDNSSRMTTGENQLPIDPEQAHLYPQLQMSEMSGNVMPVGLHQVGGNNLVGMQVPLEEDGNSASQITSRSLTFAVDGPQFEGNMESFNQRIELATMSYEYVNIIPINNSSNSGESKDS
jgi:hypothetical protein